MNATDSHRPNQQPGLPPADAHTPWPPAPTPEQERAWREPTRPAGSGAGAHQGPGVHPGYSAQQKLPAPVSVQNLATWAIVLGIVCLFFNPLAGVSIAAGACAIVALTRANTLQRAGIAVRGQGLAIAGLVMAIVGFAWTAGFKLFLF